MTTATPAEPSKEAARKCLIAARLGAVANAVRQKQDDNQTLALNFAGYVALVIGKTTHTGVLGKNHLHDVIKRQF
ncbi:hypothetical protein HFN87_13570 [Rhizobium laguerreae]|uniref:hypothetical protein n=1 Tax=Rhizobium laguerreae TaxID=1076926 RepID=UPI001C91A2D8|nr:hypothetical protein [Rhizobium laguerreae]MBY3414303.1 hypothetical protein [Rhizobium laguerreae]